MLEMLSFAVFILAIALLVYMDRKKIKLEGIVLIRRTQKGKKFIESLATGHPKFWKHFFNVAVVMSIPIMLATLSLLIFNSSAIIKGESSEGASFVLPGPVSDVTSQPGLIIMPWWIWVACIFIVMISHEFSHGIASTIGKVKIKSLGWLLLLFLPGAFVEPDEKQLKKKDLKTRLRVYAAGSFANVVVALVFLVVALVFIFCVRNICMDPIGLSYGGILIDYPMQKADVSGAIISINEIPIRSPDDLKDVLSRINPDSAIILRTTKGSYGLVTVARPDGEPGSFIGISEPYSTYYVPKAFAEPAMPLFSAIYSLLQWIFILNLGIGMINLLPIKPLDGGLIMEDISARFFSRQKTKKLVLTVSIVSFGLLVFNVIGPSLF